MAAIDQNGRLASEVAQLQAAFRAGDRQDCARRLATLRALWLERAELFDTGMVRVLREIADDLRRHGEGAEPREVLRATFGYDSFRAGQEEIIRTVLAGRDCIGVMPTGAGKSLTFQLPARLLASARGATTLVVSPLIALMKDQVDAMR